MSNNVAIGIDLGTTNSCVAVFQNEKVEIIANEQGERTTPSFVAFTDTEMLVGDEAKSRLLFDAENVVFDAKRMIGVRFDDVNLQSDLKYFPFNVTNCDDKPMIEVLYKDEVKKFYPQEISSMVLTKMRETAEEYLGHSVTNVVITVPAYFNNSQRQATKDAGIIAGLNVLQIINEPTAAAIAYGFDKKLNSKCNILVYDLGGGTLDISILAIENSKFVVKATSGDTHLGGEDFNNCLQDHFVLEFKRKFKKDITSDSRALRRLLKECERVKHKLSFRTKAKLEIDIFYDGLDFESSITRTRFEELCSDLFNRTIEPIEKALSDAKLSKMDIDEIVMIGGSSRIPKLQSLLQSYFNGKELNKSINPDEAVAYGAAIHAAKLNGEKSEYLNDLQLIDVIPLSLGIETAGGLMAVLIPRNTQVPTKATKIFTTYADNQISVLVQVYEGERLICKSNNLLGKFELTGIPLAKRHTPKIEVTLEVDNNGILNLHAIELTSGIKVNTTIQNSANRLSEEELKRLLEEADEYRNEDEKRRKQIESRNQLEQYIYDLKRKLNEKKSFIRNSLLKEIDKVSKWLESNTLAEKEELDFYREELATIFEPIENLNSTVPPPAIPPKTWKNK